MPEVFPKEAKLAYRQFCESDPTIPLFARDWWLDQVCGARGWQAHVVEQNGRIVAAMPIPLRTASGFTLITQPPLTPTLGPWIQQSSSRNSLKLAREKQLVSILADQLPPFDHFTLNCDPGFTNWLPFYWKQFTQTTRYTYVLPNLSDESALWGQLQENIRREIRKATGRFKLAVRTDSPIGDLIMLHRMSFARQGRKTSITDSLIRALDAECLKRGCRQLFVAEDAEGRAHAAAYIVWDQNSAYYLLGGGDPALRTSGAASLCLWEAIRHAATVTRRFDFEGSMIEGVERFFRGFGAVQTPYFQLSKTPSRLLRLRAATLSCVTGQAC